MTAATVPERPSDAVRVLHTSDWHLGVTVRGESRAGDHDAVIAEIVGIAQRAEPDVILHTGDLFDGHRPPMHEFGRAIRALRALAAVAPVVVLAGNHDSPVTLDVLAVACADESADARIRILPKPTLAEHGAVTTYPTQAGVHLRLVALPFVHQNRVVKDFAALVEANATYNDSLRKIIGSYSELAFDDFDPSRDVAVFASHVHVRDARTSSEKVIHIAEDYATDPAHFEPRYGYLAFGHVHVPQPVADGRGRYAGSILEVDFGEEGEQKHVVIADLVAGRPTKIIEVPLSAGRRLRRIRVPLGELSAQADALGTAIVEVTVESDGDASAADLDDRIVVQGVEFDTLSAAVAAQLPDATIVGVIDARTPAAASIDDLAAPAVVEHVGDTFRAWLGSAGMSVVTANGAGLADPVQVARLFDHLHAAVTSDAPSELAEVDQLVALLSGETIVDVSDREPAQISLGLD